MMCTLYQDELARDIGVLPSLWKLLFTDPRLAYAFYFGPVVGGWYRLQGRGSWNGARNAILNVWENTLYALNPRKSEMTWRTKIKKHRRSILRVSVLGLGLLMSVYICRFNPILCPKLTK